MKHPWMACISAVLIASSTLLAANGKSVSIVWRYGATPENPINGHFNWWGKLVRFDITNNRVVAADTLFKQTLASSPAVNVSGTKVAFARWGCRVSGNAVVGPCDSAYLSVIDINGGTPVDLLAFRAKWAFDGSGGMADDGALIEWPAGDWIYYEKPCKTAEIWKVKATDPSTNQLVRKYTGYECDKAGQTLFYFRRWSLSLDSRYAASQSCAGNLLHLPFPANGDIQSVAPTNGSRPGCNIQISPSGNFSGRYGGGWHTEINIEEWNHSTNSVVEHWANGPAWNPSLAQAQAYLGRDIGPGAAELRWSANSDKWICQTIGWYGHESSLRMGGDQLLTNWKNNEAIITTNNPKLPVGPGGTWPSDGTIYYCGSVGDFWVEPPAGTVNSYEDVNGAWHTVDVTTAMAGTKASSTISNVNIRGSSLGLAIGLPDRLCAVRMLDAGGRTVFAAHAARAIHVPRTALRPGAYVVSVRADGIADTRSVVVE